MKKKIALAGIAVFAALGSVAGLSAFEAYVINVTAQDSTGLDGKRLSGLFRIDATPPTVMSSVPPRAGTNPVDVSAAFVVTFSEPMDRLATNTSISLALTGGGSCTACSTLAFGWDTNSAVVTISHATLQTGTGYTLRVQTGARDASDPGNALQSAYVVQFNTSAVGGVVAKPGGPYTGTVGDSVPFDGSASTGTAPLNFTWEIRSSSGSLVATLWNAEPTHTFTAAGTYNITLTVRDATGTTDTKYTTATITEKTPTGFLDQYWWLLLILILAILGAIIFLVMSRRRKKPEEMPEAVPAGQVATMPPARPAAPPAPGRPAPPPPTVPPPPPAAAPAPAQAGKPQTRQCPSCGTIVEMTDKECFMCGTALA